MPAPIREVSSYRQLRLRDGWQLARAAPGAAEDPSQLAALHAAWQLAAVPGTVAATLRASGDLELTGLPNLDANDWWYRCRFDAWLPVPGRPVFLNVDGLATVADVWLNGGHVLHSENMFVAHAVDVTDLLQPTNELVIRFQSLQALLDQRKPRPRWRTRLVEHQQLRWFRTTLLGRMPGWSPRVAAVGPWRAVWLEECAHLLVHEANLRPRLDKRVGIVEASLRVAALGQQPILEAALLVGNSRTKLTCEASGDGSTLLHGDARVVDADVWWPHTHGAQPLYNARVVVQFEHAEVELDCGRLGFRSIVLETGKNAGFGFIVNDVPVFCRGACWTTMDIAALAGSTSAYRAALETARAAGMNMLRVGATMVYEADTFYDLCDQLGIMVWQDFMFANMDYPASDEGFVANVRTEALHQLRRLQSRPCLALLCGSSEVQQQAAMLGLGPELWSSSLFDDVLPAACQAICPDVAYIPSSPSGGTPPFRVDTGAAHYYGVGAYLRPLEDARRAQVRFASECLAFANIPEDRGVELIVGDAWASVQHSAWKARVPRDVGTGWDFEDVRDYYLEQLFKLDPLQLRYADTQRYLALSRVTTGEVMASVFAEWRRPGSTCRGGLVWFFQDLWPGAGWGIIDASGQPKAAYYYLKRQLRPIALFASDEGLNGLRLNVVNDTAEDLRGQLRLTLYRHGRTPVATGTRELIVPARGGVAVDAEAMLDSFVDVTYAYRFGPPGHDLAFAALSDARTGASLAEAFYFPLGLPTGRQVDVGLDAVACELEPDVYALTVRTKSFAQAVAVDVAEFELNDNYFHLEPGGERRLILRSIQSGRKLAGAVHAMNAYTGSTIRTA